MFPDENRASRIFMGECILRTTVSTTGYCGGDSEEGGRSSIVFEDLSNMYEDSSFSAEIADGTAPGADSRVKKRITINLSGDAELKTFINALRFSADALDALAKGSEDDPMCD